VDWYPWGPEALERARRERKPILLSIGYAACHWCHVMAHESFEDEAIAATMNELYVCIKVDREERPDLDRLYQLAHQMLTGRGGGWPLTMFLLHDDQRPFFGGTYFRARSAFRPARVWRSAAPGCQLLPRASGAAAGAGGPGRQRHRGPESAAGRRCKLTAEPIRACRARLEQSFDREYGGFGPAPKFPHAPGLAASAARLALPARATTRPTCRRSTWRP
jgi:uncharacterized protein